MLHLSVNFGGIWRFELGLFICFFLYFLLTKSPLIFLNSAHYAELTPYGQ